MIHVEITVSSVSHGDILDLVDALRRTLSLYAQVTYPYLVADDEPGLSATTVRLAESPEFKRDGEALFALLGELRERWFGDAPPTELRLTPRARELLAAQGVELPPNTEPAQAGVNVAIGFAGERPPAGSGSSNGG